MTIVAIAFIVAFGAMAVLFGLWAWSILRDGISVELAFASLLPVFGMIVMALNAYVLTRMVFQ